MPVTNIRGKQILDGDITRVDLNTSQESGAVIRKLIPADDASITLSSTGATVGTGDVKLVTAKATASQLGMIKVGSGLSVDTNGVLSISGTSGITGSGTSGNLAKFSSASSIGNSIILDNGTGVSIGSHPSIIYKFNTQGVSGNFISFWTPTINGANNNGIMSHNGNGLSQLTPLGYYASIHVFNGTVTGGGTLQVDGDINVSGSVKVLGVPITLNGSGTGAYITKWSNTTTLMNSILYDDYTGIISIKSVSTLSGIYLQISDVNKAIFQYSEGTGTTIGSFNASKLSFIINNIIVGCYDASARFLINSSVNPVYTNILSTTLLTNNTSHYTDITAIVGGNFRAFSYLGSSNTGFVFGTGLSNNADFAIGSYSNYTANSNMCLYAYKFNTGYYNSFTVKWNTVAINNIPTSTTGLTTGDIYKDSNGFLKIL